jgi:hypothetical protein
MDILYWSHRCNPNVANLYVKWSREQPMSSMLALTTHSQLANQILRITFRTRFKIDIVVFPPDEMNRTYTNRTRDRWLAISEWSPSGRLRSSGSANIPRIPRLCVVVAEEFEKSESGIGRRPHIGPTQLLKLTMPAPDKIIEAYKLQNILVVSP